MTTTATIKRNFNIIVLRKLIIVSLIIGFLAGFLAIALKIATDYFEHELFNKASQNWLYILIFPLFALSMIWFLRQYLFKKKENKGIREIFESTGSKVKNLPSYKIASHFVNGLLTVAFGGSTGIEVSTVVASAAIGSLAQQKENIFRKYKSELICAGVAAGITALFGSPVAGILFAYEVISRKLGRMFFLTNGLAVLAASAVVYVLDDKPLFALNIPLWNLYALPWMVVLGILAGLNSVYLTKCVLEIKKHFGKIDRPFSRIILGAMIISIALLAFPALYGDGYHALKEMFYQPTGIPLTLSLTGTLLGVLIFKPLITSVTLAAGGDGGVFAPSLFLGAFLGFLVAMVLNTFFNAAVIPVNFMVVGMAAMLSGSIHAPFTALFLVCGLTGDYTLFFPILMACLISKYVARFVLPYSVYTAPVLLIK